MKKLQFLYIFKLTSKMQIEPQLNNSSLFYTDLCGLCYHENGASDLNLSFLCIHHDVLELIAKPW